MLEGDDKYGPEIEQQLVNSLSMLMPGADRKVIRDVLRSFGQDKTLNLQTFPQHLQALIHAVRSKRS